MNTPTVQLWVTGQHRYVATCETVTGAKRIATAWFNDAAVKAFEAFVVINDFAERKVYEWDAEDRKWDVVEMWDGATPVMRR